MYHFHTSDQRKISAHISLAQNVNEIYALVQCVFNSYTMAPGVYVSKIPSSRGISDIYHLGRTHLIGERTNENSSRLFYTVVSENRSWF